jgi:hypothetical protein
MTLRTPNIAEVNLAPGQKLILATDGLLGILTTERLELEMYYRVKSDYSDLKC